MSLCNVDGLKNNVYDTENGNADPDIAYEVIAPSPIACEFKVSCATTN